MSIKVVVESELVTSQRSARVLVYENNRLVSNIVARVELQPGADGRHYACVRLEETKLEPRTTELSELNIGPWERSVAREYHLHGSWLTPSNNGEVCPCCNKLRFFEHYINRDVCVFCSCACENSEQCQQWLFFEKN